MGQTRGFDGDKALFHPDLAENIRRGDASYLALLDAADAWVARNGMDLPEEPSAREFLPDPACVTDPCSVSIWPRPGSAPSSGRRATPLTIAG